MIQSSRVLYYMTQYSAVIYDTVQQRAVLCLVSGCNDGTVLYKMVLYITVLCFTV